MNNSSKESQRSSHRKALRTLAPLGAVLAATLFATGFLMLRSRPTVVELKVTTSEVAFEVIPPLDAAAGDSLPASESAPTAMRRISLFDPSLVVQAIELKDIDCVETTLTPVGRVSLNPGLGREVRLRAGEPFTPELILMEPTDVTLEVTTRGRIRLGLSQENPVTPSSPRKATPASTSRNDCSERPAEEGGWNGAIPVAPGMSLSLQSASNIASPGGASSAVLDSGTYSIPSDALDIRIAGNRRKSWLNLALPPQETASTRILVLDPMHGKILANNQLPEALSEAHIVPWGDRLVLLEPSPTQDRAQLLLRPDLKIRGLELMRWVRLEAQSALLGGSIRFPAGEKEPLDLEPGFFLSLDVPPEQPVTLRSVNFREGRLELVLWGEPDSLRVGPTPELQFERLPSYLEWLYTHRLGGLIYATLAWVAGAGLALMKLLGSSFTPDI